MQQSIYLLFFKNSYFTSDLNIILTDKDKADSSNYKKGIYLSLFSGLSLLLVFYFYSINTSPGITIFINQSLYYFAEIVLFVFFVCIFFIIVGIKMAFFSKKFFEENPSKLIHHIQFPLQFKLYKNIFLITTIIYFVFFGFLSNFFIIFNNDGTVFSLFPSMLQQQQQKHGNMDMAKDDAMNMPKESSMDIAKNIYPKYNLIICCNSLGYVPMLIVGINNNFSFLLIPLNFLLGLIISILVGFNMTINSYLLKQIKSMQLSKKNFFGFLGMSSGLFVGCPTCAGSFFYSLAGFSSIITFSYLGLYQILFIAITIPILIISIITMAKMLFKNYLSSCKIK